MYCVTSAGARKRASCGTEFEVVLSITKRRSFPDITDNKQPKDSPVPSCPLKHCAQRCSHGPRAAVLGQMGSFFHCRSCSGACAGTAGQGGGHTHATAALGSSVQTTSDLPAAQKPVHVSVLMSPTWGTAKGQGLSLSIRQRTSERHCKSRGTCRGRIPLDEGRGSWCELLSTEVTVCSPLTFSLEGKTRT